MSVEFTINKEIALNSMVNDFIDTGYDKIFTQSNMPDKFESTKSDFNTIMSASSSINFFLYVFTKVKISLLLYLILLKKVQK